MPDGALEALLPENVAMALRDEPDAAGFLEAYSMLDRQPVEALRRLEMLADQGSLLSLVFLGDAYLYGRGVDPDVERGKAYLFKAAKAGSIEASFRLARFLGRNGDTEESIDALRKLAERGYSPAMYLLGWRYYRGIGVDEDPVAAFHYWKMADRNGHLLARQHLLHTYRSGRCGVGKRILGYLGMVGFIPVFVKYKMKHPNSDRLRQWAINSPPELSRWS